MGLRLLLTSFATGVSAVLLGVVLVSTLLTSDPVPRPSGSSIVDTTQLSEADPTRQPSAEESTSSPSLQPTPTEEFLPTATATETPAPTIAAATPTPQPVLPGAVPSPVGLFASYTEGGVSLTWNVVAGAAYYNIYRSQLPGGGLGATYTAIGSSGSPSARDTSIASGQIYYYVVTASSGGVESDSSNEATIRVP